MIEWFGKFKPVSVGMMVTHRITEFQDNLKGTGLNTAVGISTTNYASKRTGDESPYYAPTHNPRNLQNP